LIAIIKDLECKRTRVGFDFQKSGILRTITAKPVNIHKANLFIKSQTNISLPPVISISGKLLI